MGDERFRVEMLKDPRFLRADLLADGQQRSHDVQVRGARHKPFAVTYEVNCDNETARVSVTYAVPQATTANAKTPTATLSATAGTENVRSAS